MKTKLPLLVCMVIFAGAVKAQIPSGIGSGPSMWPRYTVKGEEFSVTLPNMPSMISRKVPLAGTNKDRMERTLQASIGDVHYTIYIYENPKPRQSLEDFILEQTADSTRLVISERTLTIDGRPGKEYFYTSNDKPVTEQFFAADKRLYKFVASGAATKHAGVQQFFSSLAFGKKRSGFEVSDGPGEAPTASGPARIYVGREVDIKTRLISKPEPSYTARARNKQIEGTVILKVVFASNGQVTNIRVAQGLPEGLTERAIAAARKIKFVPAMKDERPVSMWMQLEYNFHLY